MEIDLKYLREELNRERKKLKPDDPGLLSQSGLAQLLSQGGREISQAQVSRYEDDASAMSLDLLEDWLRCLGTSLANELGKARTEAWCSGLDFGRPYSELDQQIAYVTKYVDQESQRGPQQWQELCSEFREHLNRLGRKPGVLVAGMFDAGKTTVTNWLLGGEGALTESYSPTTAVPTYIHHIDEIPGWMTEYQISEGQCAAIIGDGWSYLRDGFLDKPSSLLRVGDLDTLAKLGTHTSGVKAPSARYALVFLDRPILHSCNILDLPGYGHSDQDDASARVVEVVGAMDVMLYLSSTNQFFSGPDAAYFEFLVDRLSPLTGSDKLAHLFLIATHAHQGISDDDLETQVIGPAAKRLVRCIPSRLHSEPDVELCRKRIFPFYREFAERNSRLEKGLQDCLGQVLPARRRTHANESVGKLVSVTTERLAERIKTYESVSGLFGPNESPEKVVGQFRNADATMLKKQNELFGELESRVSVLGEEHVSSFSAEFDALIKKERIEEIISKRYGEDKKSAMKNLSGELMGQLEEAMDNTAMERIEQLKKLLEEFDNDINTTFRVHISGSPAAAGDSIDLRPVLVGGASAGVTAASFAFWAASFGNLGGYAATATALGWVGLGGASYMSALAAIGGPMTLAVGLSVASYFVGRSIFGANWQGRLASQMVTQFKKRNPDGMTLRDGLIQSIQEFWGGVSQHIRSDLDQSRNQSSIFLEELVQVAEDVDDTVSFEALIDELERTRDKVARFPWLPL